MAATRFKCYRFKTGLREYVAHLDSDAGSIYFNFNMIQSIGPNPYRKIRPKKRKSEDDQRRYLAAVRNIDEKKNG